MIHLIPTGGLGNQMFQYAAARTLSLRLKTELVIDLSFYELHRNKSWNRSYELDIFDLRTSVRNKNFKGVTMCRLKEIFEKFAWKIENLLPFGLFADICPFTYDNRFEQLKNGIMLFGYFQNETYFQNYVEEICQDFTFIQPLNEQNQVIADEILACNSVSIHIRRGDYLSDKNAANTFANLSLAYYHAAIQHIINNVKEPRFFVFSDDMEWAKQQFDEYSCYFVNVNHGKNSYNDMRLMSICKHNIIANSSFSWWGAYLNNHSEKIVIAPENWFIDNEKNISNLLPKKWIKM
jgi:hypothetical protein